MTAPEARPSPLGLVIDGPIDATDAVGLYERVRDLLEGSHTGLVVCDVARLVGGDLGTVAVLARLQLIARRLGGSIQVRNASPELHDTLALAGLCEVVGACPSLRVEMRGEIKHREEAGGVKKEGDAADLIA